MAFTWKLKLNNVNKIIQDHGLDLNGKVTRYLRDDCDRFMDAYIPMDTGTLKNSKTYPSNHEITYTQQYAHYMYKGVKAVGATKPKGVSRMMSNAPLIYHKGAPKRGKEWDKRMLNDKKKTIINDVSRFIGGK